MIDNRRRVCLSVGTVASYGIGASGDTTLCNVTEAFTITDTINQLDLDVICGCEAKQPIPDYSNVPNIGDPVTCSYPLITEEQLGKLSACEFEKRMGHYLNHLSVDSDGEKKHLIEESTFNDGEVTYECKLNPDFFAYLIFDGARVINAGSGNGEIQYKAYLFGDDADSASWQTNATFLSLNTTSTYVFEIRDVVNGVEVCKVTKTINLDNLVQSTTEPPKNVILYLEDVNTGVYGDTKYSCGNIKVNPALTPGDAFNFTYCLSSNSTAGGFSCVDVCCNGTVVNTISADDSISDSMLMSASDDVSYNLFVRNSDGGDCSCNDLKLTGVESNRLIIPSIDVGKCSVSVEGKVDVVPMTVSLMPSNNVANTESGYICFNPAIPNGQWVDVNLCGTATARVDGFSSVTLKTCPDGGSWTLVDSIGNQQSQPMLSTIRVNPSDTLKYGIRACADEPSDFADSCVKLLGVSSSSAIQATVDPVNNSSYVSECTEALPSIVSVCRQNLYSQGPERVTSNGFINVSPDIEGSQSISMNVASLVQRMIRCCSDACAEIHCKPNGSSSFTKIHTFSKQEYSGPTQSPKSVTVNYEPGDRLCYVLWTDALDSFDSYAHADIRLCSVSGVNGAKPVINTNSSKQCDSVSANNRFGEDPYDYDGY